MNPSKLIAPCGMNCALCQAYQGKGIKCYGCRNQSKRKSCQNCRILHCDKKQNFCYECEQFPCKRLKQLDKRYQIKYHMSMLENLNEIKENGMKSFIQTQAERYTCEHCGNLKSVHTNTCLYCTLKKEQ